MHAIVTVVLMANNILLRKSGGLEKNKALWWVGATQRRQQQRERRWRRNREELTRTKCLNNRKRFLRADLNHTRLQIYPVIGLRGMDSTSTAIFYFVQGGLYDRSERRSPPPSSSPSPTVCNHRLFSRFLPKINSRFHGRIFGVVTFYTVGRNQNDRFADEVYT